MKSFLSIPFIAGTLLVQTAVYSSNYYIDDDGNDAANCHTATTCGQVNTCRTFGILQSRVGSFQAGDVINFCDGVYREKLNLLQNGGNGSPITLRKEPSAAEARVSGADLCSSWTSDGAGVYHCPYTPQTPGCLNGFQKLFVDDAPVARSQANGCPSPVTNLSSAGYCANFPRQACTSSADCTSVGGGACVNAGWCYDGTNIYLHKSDGSSPASNIVEAGSRTNNLVIANRSNLTIDGLTLDKAESYCTDRDYVINGSNVGAGIIIKNNKLQWGCGGLYLTGADAPVIDSNSFTNMCQGWSYPGVGIESGLFFTRTQSNSTSITFTNNTMSNVGTVNWARSLSGNCGWNGGTNTLACNGATLIMQSPHGLIKVNNNTITNGQGVMLLEVSRGGDITKGSEMANNTMKGWDFPGVTNCHNTCGMPVGIMVTCAVDSGVSDCTNSGVGTPAPVVHEFKIHGNKIYNAARGIVSNFMRVPANDAAGDAYTVAIYNNFVKAGNRAYGNDLDAAIHIDAHASSQHVYNNSLQCMTGDSVNSGSGFYVDSTASSIAIANNIFDFNGCGTKLVDSGNAGAYTATSNLCGTAITGKCSAGADTLSYLNESVGDFHLVAGDSAAIDKGVAFTEFNDDIGGQPRPAGAWDIGADELGSNDTTPPKAPTNLRVK